MNNGGQEPVTPLAFSPVPLDEKVGDADGLSEYMNVMNKSIYRLRARTSLYTVVTDFTITTTNNNMIQFSIQEGQRLKVTVWS